jgi:ABC-2 type transport system permease protein
VAVAVAPFARERWWVLALFAAAVAGQGALAYVLAGRRDVGMSVVPTRPGPPVGRLGTAGALAWRLQRGAVLGWSIGFFLAGVKWSGGRCWSCSGSRGCWWWRALRGCDDET